MGFSKNLEISRLPPKKTLSYYYVCSWSFIFKWEWNYQSYFQYSKITWIFIKYRVKKIEAYDWITLICYIIIKSKLLFVCNVQVKVETQQVRLKPVFSTGFLKALYKTISYWSLAPRRSKAGVQHLRYRHQAYAAVQDPQLPAVFRSKLQARARAHEVVSTKIYWA